MFGGIYLNSLTMPTTNSSGANSVVTRTVIISSVILTGIFIILFFLEDNLAGIFGKYAGEVVTGLMLLALWIVVSSAVRSVNNLVKNIPGWKMLLTGVATAAVSAVLYTAFLLVFPRVSKSSNALEVAGISGGMILLLGVLGFIISLIALVNVRVKNRMLGNVLEFLIIGGAIALFLYFVNR
jgi:hypothetical protein